MITRNDGDHYLELLVSYSIYAQYSIFYSVNLFSHFQYKQLYVASWIHYGGLLEGQNKEKLKNQCLYSSVPMYSYTATLRKVIHGGIWWPLSLIPACYILFIISLKRQCISMEAMQSWIISQPLKSLLNGVLQEFAEHK